MISMVPAGRGVLLAVLAALVLAGCGGDESVRDDESGELLEATQLNVFELQVGDCLSEFSQSDEISQVQAVPCSAEHSDEVFASANMSGEDFPGSDAVADFAEQACLEEFEQFVGLAWEESELDYGYLAPTEASWADGDRQVLCIISDPQTSVTGTLQGANR